MHLFQFAGYLQIENFYGNLGTYTGLDYKFTEDWCLKRNYKLTEKVTLYSSFIYGYKYGWWDDPVGARTASPQSGLISLRY